MTKPLAGMYAALMTGMDDDGAFDAGRQSMLTAHVLTQGLTGLYVGAAAANRDCLRSMNWPLSRRSSAATPRATARP